ncbi:MAG TPA: ATP-binding protein [Actinomycetota bacterium]|nr:ATP-binding protein [Actinomycetota bacterium]
MSAVRTSAGTTPALQPDRTAWHPRLFPWALAACAGSLVFMAVGIFRFVDYRDVRMIHFLVVASFEGVGLYAWRRRPESPMGALMAAVGFAYFVPHVAILDSPVTSAISQLTQSLYQAVLAHLALSFPGGRLESRTDRRIVVATYAWVMTSAFLGQLFYDPAQYGCDCPRNLLLIHADRSVNDVINIVEGIIGIGVLAMVLVGIIRHWRRMGSRSRRAYAPVAWTAGPIGLVIVWQNVVDGLNLPDPLGVQAFGYGPIVYVLLPAMYLVTLLRNRLDRSAVGDLVVELDRGVAPGELSALIGRALGDPSARLAFRREDGNAYVDSEGQPVELRTAPAVAFVDDGRTIAILHDQALTDEPELVRSVAAAARIALENERLRAEVRAQLEEVRASRQRIVEAGDAERRRVERNLHDGAQQRLLTLSLSLRLTMERLGDDADPELRRELDEAAAEAARAVQELRELGRGIHPAVLTGSGLAAALESLAERSPLPVTLDAASNGRLPEPVEVTAYYVVSEALANCQRHAGASSVRVATALDGGDLVVTVTDDGRGGADVGAGSGLRGLEDRVAALGGRLTVESAPGRGTTVRAEIPV